MDSLFKRFFGRFQRKKKALVLGDSHVSVFEHKVLKKCFNRYRLHTLSVGGATVSGLQNPNSKTQALPLFLKELDKIEPELIILQLGEVDTGFVIWYRAEKYNVSIDEMMDKAITNYKELIIRLSKRAQVICISTPLPTIKDEQEWGDIANARKEVSSSQHERTALTIKFNTQMEKICQTLGIAYLNLDSESLGEEGVVDNKLMNSDPLDHHYEQSVYAEILTNRLKYVIEK